MLRFLFVGFLFLVANTLGFATKFEVVEQRDGILEFSKHAPSADEDIFYISLPSRKELNQALSQGGEAFQDLWMTTKKRACERNQCGDPAKEWVDVERVIRFTNIESLHTEEEKAAWREQIFASNFVHTDENAAFLTHVTTEPNYQFDLATWEEKRKSIAKAKLNSSLWISIRSASLGTHKSPKIYPADKNQVGLVVKVPEGCIFAASPVNLLIGGRDDFYRETLKGYGARFLKILAENSLRPPKDLLDTTKDWTEVCYDAPSAEVVAVLRQGDNKRLNGLAKLFATKHNLTLIDAIPD
ncbi:MAG: hypothetical protein V6Z78_01935 [Holosporaceae bacterium]